MKGAETWKSSWWSDDSNGKTWSSWSQDDWREAQSHLDLFFCQTTKDGNLPVTDQLDFSNIVEMTSSL